MTTPLLTSTFYDDVETALWNQLLTVAGIPGVADRVPENRAYTPKGVPYLLWSFRPQPNQLADINADAPRVRHTGTVLIDYFVPQGTGTVGSNAVVSGIVAALRPGKQVTSNGILVTVRRCFANTGLTTPDLFFQRPITLAWTADTLCTP